MIFYLLIGVLGLIVALYLLRAAAYTDTKTLLRGLKWTAVGVIGAAGTYLLVSGRFMQAVFAVSAMAPMFVRWRAAWRTMRNAARSTGAWGQGPAPGNRSTIDTTWVTMVLDHDSGTLAGRVLQGRFKDRELSDLTLDELIELWRECRQSDAQAAALVETYLDRTQPPEWRAQAGAGAAGQADAGQGSGATAAGSMTRAHALAILGLTAEADEESIRDAHRRLMMANHPDRGGSTFIAAQINQAKDVLLGTASRSPE